MAQVCGEAGDACETVFGGVGRGRGFRWRGRFWGGSPVPLAELLAFWSLVKLRISF